MVLLLIYFGCLDSTFNYLNFLLLIFNLFLFISFKPLFHPFYIIYNIILLFVLFFYNWIYYLILKFYVKIFTKILKDKNQQTCFMTFEFSTFNETKEWVKNNIFSYFYSVLYPSFNHVIIKVMESYIIGGPTQTPETEKTLVSPVTSSSLILW